MNSHHQFPMVRLLVPFITGIALSLSFYRYVTGLDVLLGITFLFLLIWVLPARRKGYYRFRWFFGAGASFFLFALGFYLTQEKHAYHDNRHFSKYDTEMLLGRICDEPVEKKQSWKLLVEVSDIREKTRFFPVHGRLLVYLRKTGTAKPPAFGDLVLMHGKTTPPLPPLNPNSFDYRSYLLRIGISRQIWLQPEELRVTGHSRQDRIKGLSLELRHYLLSQLRNNHLEGRELGVAATLILGVDELLDYETRQEYSHAGVVHILGISGLHVGILYLAMNLFLGFLKKTRQGRWLRPVLLLAVIWFYALLTGLSPAAQRASAMFTFVIFGELGNRRVHISNSLASSAFFLLFFDPYLLLNPGFLFSYIAVTGIVLIHEPIYSSWEPRWWLTDKVWSLTVMSLAAQLFTFPLTLYYFHQFPTYFFPANLVVIPLSNLIICSGMAILGTFYIPLIGPLLGTLTSYLIKALNYTAGFVESLPGAVIGGISISLTETLVLYSFVVCTGVWLCFGKRRWLPAALVFLLVFSGSMSLKSFNRSRQQKVIVFALNRHSAVARIQGSRCILMADTAFLNEPGSFDYQLSGSMAGYGIRKTEFLSLDSTLYGYLSGDSLHLPKPGYFFTLNKKRLGIIKGLPGKDTIPAPLKLDILVITGNPKVDISKLLKFYQPRMIVADASNAAYKTTRWKEDCNRARIRFRDIRNEGAFVLNAGEN